MSTSSNPLVIDIPVEMQQVKSVHSIGALQFEGDLPASIFHLQLITRDIADWRAQSEVVADLMKQGLNVELFGATARVNGWGTADLLPGVRINLDAMARTIQLVQQGFVKITE